MAEECIRSPRNQLPCVLPYTWEAHRAGHRTADDVDPFQRSHWPTTPEEKTDMQKVDAHG